MNLTIAEVTAAVMWITIMDIAILANVAAWVTIKWLFKIAKEI